MSDKLFRTNVIGGYNKKDVHSYISMLEKKLTRTQEELEEQIDLGEKSQKKIRANVDEDVVILSDRLEGVGESEERKEEVEKALLEERTPNPAFEEQERELAAVKQELEKVKGELVEARVELGISNQRYEQSEQKKESLLELIQRLVENYSGLQTSQFYLAEQVKNIGRMEKKIELIQSDVEHILKVERLF